MSSPTRHILAGTLALWLSLLAASALALDPAKGVHQYFSHSWGLDDGLLQAQVTSIVQDAEGYIWVGTRGGLEHFDGVRFETYLPQNTPALRGGEIITALFNDSSNRLWIGTYKGLAIHENGTFRNIPLPDGSAFTVRGFASAPDGRVLITSDRGLLVSSGITVAAVPGGKDLTHAILVHEDEVWAGGIGFVRRIGDTTQDYALPAGSKNVAVGELVVYRGILWAGTPRGLLQLREGQWQPAPLPPRYSGLSVNGLYCDADGVLWVALSERLVRFSGERFIDSPPGDPLYPEVRAFAEDHEGNLWLGSDFRGLTSMSNGVATRLSTREGLNTPVVWSVAADANDPDALWVGTRQGVSRFSQGRFDLIIPASDLPHPGAYTLLSEPERLWIGTRAGGLAVYENGQTRIPAGTGALAGAQVSSILRTSEGVLWLATSEGLCAYVAEELSCYSPSPDTASVPGVRYIHEAADGALLVGSQTGLFRFEDGLMERMGAGVVPVGLDVTVISELDDGMLVVGGLADELYVRMDNQWQAFGWEQGLPTYAPFFVTEDSRGRMWIAGEGGLYRMPLKQVRALAAQRIDSLDVEYMLSEVGDGTGGEKSLCCNGAGRSKGMRRDGRLWLPTRDGLISVNTSRVSRNAAPPNVVIEELRVGGKWTPVTSGEITLAPHQRDLAIRFTALSFQAPDSVHLRYRMVGLDTAWNELEDSSMRLAFYTNLPAGTHRFEVRGSNNVGVWQEQPASITVTVSPYFHETMLFRALVLLALVMLFYLGYRVMLANHRRQEARLNAIIEARTEALRVANRQLEQASLTDALTGLWNRRYLQEQLPADIAALQRKLGDDSDDAPVMAFALIDIDHFKQLNDTYGHAAGDQVLREFAGLISGLVRASDYVVRWGGEEFVLVLRDTTVQRADQTLLRILTAVADQPFRFLGDRADALQVSCSIGYACYPFIAQSPTRFSWEQVLNIADRALYVAKNEGRNRAVGLLSGHGLPDGCKATDMQGSLKDLLADAALIRRDLQRRSPASEESA